MTTLTPLALLALESQMRDEAERMRQALVIALQHATNVGRAYGGIQDFLTQSEVQAWLAGPTCPLGPARRDVLS